LTFYLQAFLLSTVSYNLKQAVIQLLVEHIPAKTRVKKTFVFKLKTAIKISDGMTSRSKTNRTIRIPMKKQRSIGRIILPKRPKGMNWLARAKPAATMCFTGIYWRQQMIFLTSFLTIDLCPVGCNKRTFLRIFQIMKAFWLISA